MRHATMLSALTWILQNDPAASFEVTALTPDLTGAMQQYPEMELPAEDAWWITEYLEGNNPEVAGEALFEVSGGGEAVLGYILAYYAKDGSALRIYAAMCE